MNRRRLGVGLISIIVVFLATTYPAHADTLPDTCGQYDSAQSGGIFDPAQDSTEYSSDGYLIYRLHLRNPSAADDAFHVTFQYFTDRCENVTLFANGPQVTLLAGVSDISIRFTSMTVFDIWDDTHNTLLIQGSIEQYPSYMSVRPSLDTSSPISFLYTGHTHRIYRDGAPPIVENSVEKPAACPPLQIQTDGLWFDHSYERAEYVGGLLRVHLRFQGRTVPADDFPRFMFRQGVVPVKNEDCTFSPPLNSLPQIIAPYHSWYYSYRFIDSTHWVMWDDERDVPFLDVSGYCDSCSGTIASTTKYVYWLADRNGRFMRTTPFPPVEPTTTCTPGVDENCNSNVMFLPGIEASRLYGFFGQQLWEPSSDDLVEKLFLDSNGDSESDGIYTSDVIDEVNILPNPLRANIYKSFLADLNDWKNTGLIEDYSAIPYDWRVTIDEILTYGRQTADNKIYYAGSNVFRATSTPFVIQQLRHLAGSSRTGKVTVVAHSNGGLVAKRLIQILGAEAESLIDNLVLVAVPQTGTPLAVGALLDGTDQGHFPVLSTETARAFAKNAPTAYQLLPSRAYFDAAGADVSTPPITFEFGEATQIFTDAYGQSIDSYEELERFVVGIEGRIEPDAANVTYPQLGNSTLMTEAGVLHGSIDDNWNPPSTVQVYQVAGWGNDTLGSITYKEGGFFHCLFNNPCLDEKLEIVVDGDETVVVPSALAISTTSNNVSRYWVDLTKFNNDHANILEIEQLRGFIKNVLTAGSAAEQTPNILVNEPDNNEIQRLRYQLHSPLSLELFDVTGNKVGQYKKIGDIKFASVSANSPVTLVMHGQSAGGFTLEVEEVDGPTSHSVTFADIPSEPNTVITMSFPDGSLETAGPLKIDFNGDGAVDQSVAPNLDGTVMGYKWIGFSQPINDTTYQQGASPSIFKAGSTIPVKFQLRKHDGSITQALSAPTWLAPIKGSGLSTSINEPAGSVAASTGNTFKWDPAVQQYIYNWSTKGLAAGYWYTIYANVDGITYSGKVGLK